MIAIDMTFIIVDEIKKGYLYKSFSVFIAELLDEIAKEKKEKNFCLVSYYYQKTFLENRFPDFKVFGINFFPFQILFKITNGKYTCSSYLKKLGMYNHKLIKENVTGIWFPYALPQNVVNTNIPYIITIHDMIMYKTKHLGIAWEKRFKKIAHKCNNIVVISEETRKDVYDLLNCDYKKICKIPNSITISEDVEKIDGIKIPFILDINGFGKHKNTLTLIKAFEIISKNINIDLICCGGWKEEEYYSEIQEYIRTHDLINKIHILYGIPEKNKNWLLKNAALFVTPSLSEGFGRTPIEAIMSEIPVISTKQEALYEVTQGKVHYYNNSLDYYELAKTISNVLIKRDSEEKLKELALEFKKEYAPSSCVEKYINIFKINNWIEQ